MLLVKNAQVYAPAFLGKRDVLIAGGQIAAIEEDLSPALPDLEVLDAKGKALVPGFIDQHVHITGGGGEGGRGDVPRRGARKGGGGGCIPQIGP